MPVAGTRVKKGLAMLLCICLPATYEAVVHVVRRDAGHGALSLDDDVEGAATAAGVPGRASSGAGTGRTAGDVHGSGRPRGECIDEDQASCAAMDSDRARVDK